MGRSGARSEFSGGMARNPLGQKNKARLRNPARRFAQLRHSKGVQGGLERLPLRASPAASFDPPPYSCPKGFERRWQERAHPGSQATRGASQSQKPGHPRRQATRGASQPQKPAYPRD